MIQEKINWDTSIPVTLMQRTEMHPKASHRKRKVNIKNLRKGQGIKKHLPEIRFVLNPEQFKSYPEFKEWLEKRLQKFLVPDSKYALLGSAFNTHTRRRGKNAPPPRLARAFRWVFVFSLRGGHIVDVQMKSKGKKYCRSPYRKVYDPSTDKTRQAHRHSRYFAIIEYFRIKGKM